MGAALPLLRAHEVTTAAAERLLPPGRLSPTTAAVRYLKNEKGDFDLSVAPMIAEPLDAMAGRDYQGIVFAGPQRSSKSFGLVFGSLTWIVTCAPGDAKLIHITQETARKWSRQELDRVIKQSPELRDRLSPRPRDDNTFDKWFRSGMSFSVGWPSLSQLSGDTLKYILITDHDRPENRDDVDGQGPLWDLAFKRIETFMSRGKCLAESSPGSDVMDGNWEPSPDEPHEAPPCRGILSVYNLGTRARWYWPCLHCNAFFQAEPGYALFGLPSFERLEKIVQEERIETLVEEFARVVCPHCQTVHRQTDKVALNSGGRWIHEGEVVKGDKVTGQRRQSNIWSGWLGGVAASYQRWDSLIRNYLNAVATYARTRDESGMRLAHTSDAGAPYVPRVIRNRRVAEDLVKRAEVWPKGRVPEGPRFLTAAADVQLSRFVVQVHGWGVGNESWLIDRFDISSSKRPEGDRFAAVQPASYIEDWMLLLEVAQRTYQLVDSEIALPVLFMLVDSGGKAGVTSNAYNFHRRLQSMGFGERIQLLAGDPRLEAPRIKKTAPDQRKRRDRGSGARGDVPVWRINANVFKDGVAGDLAREDPGPGYIHLPDWLNHEQPGVFDELVAEVRTDKGWRNPNGRANEATDLASYNRAAMVAIGGERIDWDNPPPWAAPPAEQPALRHQTRRRRKRRVINSGVRY